MRLSLSICLTLVVCVEYSIVGTKERLCLVPGTKNERKKILRLGMPRGSFIHCSVAPSRIRWMRSSFSGLRTRALTLDPERKEEQSEQPHGQE